MDYFAGLFPTSVTVGDLNGDGRPDLVVANQLSDTISVMIANANATFAASVNYATGTTPRHTTIEDLNGDGIPDLAVVTGGSNAVSILRGNGNGTFAAATSEPVGTDPSDIASGDFNEDGRVDLATANFQSTDVSILTAVCAQVTMIKSHVGSFTQGQTGATYELTPYNVGPIATRGVVSVTDDRSDPTTVNASGLIAPTRLRATAASTTQINLTWDAVTTAVSYRVYRRDHNGAFALIATVPGTTHPDTGLAPNTTYVYRVYALAEGSAQGPGSNIDLSTTVLFTDDPVVAGGTVIKAVHHAQLRTAVNAVRAAAGLGDVVFTYPTGAGLPIRAVDITQLRAGLDAACLLLDVPPLIYTDPSLTGARPKAAHLQEIRAGTK